MPPPPPRVPAPPVGCKVALHWFRKGLRLHDNSALLAAAAGATAVLPVVVLDPHFCSARVSANRYSFLLATLRDLDAALSRRGSRLVVLRGHPSDVLPAFAAAHGVTHATWEDDSAEPYAAARDAAVRAALDARREAPRWRGGRSGGRWTQESGAT